MPCSKIAGTITVFPFVVFSNLSASLTNRAGVPAHTAPYLKFPNYWKVVVVVGGDGGCTGWMWGEPEHEQGNACFLENNL